MVLSDCDPGGDHPVSAATALLAVRSRRTARPAPSLPRAFAVVALAVTILFQDRSHGIVGDPRSCVADVAATTGADHALAFPPP
jgi:hypothetical protein